MTTARPTLTDVLREWQGATLGLVRVACPAVVQSYDPATLTAVVQLTAPLLIDGAPVAVPPVACPVAFPSSAGASITWPLAAGDTGLVVFADRSTDGWRSEGVANVPPQDARRFGLEDGHFVPASVGSAPAATQAAAAIDALVLRASEVRAGAAASSAVALDPLVRDELNRLWAALVAVNAAIPTGVAVTPLPATGSAAAGSVASTTLKAE